MNIPVGKNGFVHASKKKERNEAKLQRRWRFPPFDSHYITISYFNVIIGWEFHLTVTVRCL